MSYKYRPGYELDKLVAIALGGTSDKAFFKFSTDYHSAALLLKATKMWELWSIRDGVRCRLVVGSGAGQADGVDIPHAVCLAFLAAKENQVQRGCCGDD